MRAIIFAASSESAESSTGAGETPVSCADVDATIEIAISNTSDFIMAP
jgi:hypothetical protein